MLLAHRGHGLFLLGLGVLLSCAVQAAVTIEAVVDEYPPYNYFDENAQLTGISIDILHELRRRSGVEVTLTPMAWPKAYGQALHKPNILLIDVARSKRREKLFTWIGKVGNFTVYLYKLRKREDIRLQSLEDAMSLRVGGVKRYDTTVWLRQQRVPILELIYNWQGLSMLQLGHLDLMPYEEIALAYDAARLNYPVRDFVKAMKIRELSIEFALSQGSDPETAKRLRQHFEAMRKDGTIQRIYDQYVYLDVYHQPKRKLFPASVEELLPLLQ